jgi:hypothetical protein
MSAQCGQGWVSAFSFALELKKGSFMKNMTFAFAASLLMVACAPAFAAHSDSNNASGSYTQKAENRDGKTYRVARGGHDDGANHDQFDDNGGR